MPDDIVARSPMADVEDRLGIEPIDELLAERNALIEKVADLRARYGAFGTADHLRKIQLSQIKSLIRVQALRDKRKVTNDQVDDEAHSHPFYVEHVTTMTSERAEWVRLEARIEAIDMTIMRGQAVARFAANEARL